MLPVWFVSGAPGLFLHSLEDVSSPLKLSAQAKMHSGLGQWLVSKWLLEGSPHRHAGTTSVVALFGPGKRLMLASGGRWCPVASVWCFLRGSNEVQCANLGVLQG